NSFSLILLCSHLVFDGMSNEVLRDQLLNNYYDTMDKGTKVQVYDYRDYVDQIMKGPQNIRQSQIYQTLQLEEFKQAVKQYKKLTENVIFKQVQYTFHVDEYLLKQWQHSALELSEIIYLRVLKYFFPESKVPLLIVHNGRKYM